MSCAACGKPRAEGDEVIAAQKKTLPTDQCLRCAQKHLDEAYCLYLEYGYARENLRLVRGNLRAIVLHAYRSWPEIASLARECALLVQDGKDAAPSLRRLGDLIDDALEQRM